MHRKRAVLFVNGELKNAQVVRDLLHPDDLLVAVDGGLRHLETLGLKPHHVVGDLDSVTGSQIEGLERDGIKVRRFPVDKDETDLELALDLVREEKIATILIAAALGGRTDQTLGNLFLLIRKDLKECDVRLDDGVEEVFLVRGETEIWGCVGDLVSLIPLGHPAHGVTTSGLKYPLENETLWPEQARGISNVLTDSRAKVDLKSGQLLCIHVRQDVQNCLSDKESE